MNVKQDQVITKDTENIMWTIGVLDNRNAQELLDMLLYVLGLNLELRGRDEHCHLHHKQAQIMVHMNGCKFLEYREDVSKTNGGPLHSGRQRQNATNTL